MRATESCSSVHGFLDYRPKVTQLTQDFFNKGERRGGTWGTHESLYQLQPALYLLLGPNRLPALRFCTPGAELLQEGA